MRMQLTQTSKEKHYSTLCFGKSQIVLPYVLEKQPKFCTFLLLEKQQNCSSFLHWKNSQIVVPFALKKQPNCSIFLHWKHSQILLQSDAWREQKQPNCSAFFFFLSYVCDGCNRDRIC